MGQTIINCSIATALKVVGVLLLFRAANPLWVPNVECLVDLKIMFTERQINEKLLGKNSYYRIKYGDKNNIFVSNEK